MKALSIRQPWAWAIVQGHKPVENRTWECRHTGPLLIHAGQQFDDEGLQSMLAVFPDLRAQLPARWDLGGIVGVAEAVECVTSHPSRWFTGPYGLVLANARPLVFVPWRGQLGVFNVPDEFQGSGLHAVSPAEAEAQAGQQRMF